MQKGECMSELDMYRYLEDCAEDITDYQKQNGQFSGGYYTRSFLLDRIKFDFCVNDKDVTEVYFEGKEMYEG